MAWRIVEIKESEKCELDLSNSELIGISVLLTNWCRKPEAIEAGVYWRAMEKIRTQVNFAFEREGE